MRLKLAMRLGVIGINHKSAELELREWVAKACQSTLSGVPIVLLSTCSRTEIYFSGSDLAAVHSELLALLRKAVGVPFEHALYAYFGLEAFAHLARVVTGLDSVIIGESEIQGQVKAAYEQGQLEYRLSRDLHFTFQKALHIGKEMRCRFPAMVVPATLETTLFELCEWIIHPLHNQRLLLLGNSTINRQILSLFQRRGMRHMTLCTRTPHTADAPHVVSWEELARWQEYEIVICATKHRQYLIRPEQLHGSCRTQLICDLSLPRIVDPRLAVHPHINLFNIEQLNGLCAQKKAAREQEMASAEQFVRRSVERLIEARRRREEMVLTCA